MMLLAARGDLVVGTLDRTAAVAQTKSAAPRVAGDRPLMAVEIVLERLTRRGVFQVVGGDGGQRVRCCGH